MGQQNSSIADKSFNPTIVVFGDQSSGKSSVVKRLIGLPLPIGSIKCTCAPFEIRVSPSRESLRKISLLYVEDKNRKPTTPKEIEFADITDLEEQEIEDKLREAQRYAQNPSINFKDKKKLPTGTDELVYTKNTVCITLKDSNQKYNLNIVDLPGIVRNDENHERFLLSLAREYIKNETTILVPVFQATSDIDTQCAYRLSQEVDPGSERTMGVLTKIDRIANEEERHPDLAALVKNPEYKLCIIRNPSSGHLETGTPDELEKDTIETLKRNIIWKDVPSDRFGIQNLTTRLSEASQRVREQFWCTIS